MSALVEAFADTVAPYELSPDHEEAILAGVREYLAHHCARARPDPLPPVEAPRRASQEAARGDASEAEPTSGRRPLESPTTLPTPNKTEPPAPPQVSRKPSQPPKDAYAHLYRLEGDARSQPGPGQMWGDATVPTTATLKSGAPPGGPSAERRPSGGRAGDRRGSGPSIFERLTDHTKYTGTHAHRFASDGTGRGLAGRDTGSVGTGTHANRASGDGKLVLRSNFGAGTGLRTNGRTTYVSRTQNHVL